MKSAVVLCVLAMACCFHTGDAANNALTAAITRLKSTTQSTINDLTRYGNNLPFNLRTKLVNLKIDQLGNINTIVNPAINDIRSQIAAAKENGKDAESCFEPARLRLREASLTAGKELDQCVETGLATINPVKSNIDATIQVGNRIINELDLIAINCYSPNIIAMQNCIAGQLPGANASVKTLQNTATELKRTGDSVSSNAVVSAFSCNQNPITKVRQEATNVRLDAKKCIDNA